MNKKLFILLVFIDQLTKLLAQFLGFNIIFNKGISLNLLNFIPNYLITLLIILLIIFVFIIFKKDWFKYPISTAFFFGGGVSNILDRVFYGAVKDWLKVPVFNIHNNLADWFIFGGLGLFLFFLLKERKQI